VPTSGRLAEARWDCCLGGDRPNQGKPRECNGSHGCDDFAHLEVLYVNRIPGAVMGTDPVSFPQSRSRSKTRAPRRLVEVIYPVKLLSASREKLTRRPVLTVFVGPARLFPHMLPVSCVRSVRHAVLTSWSNEGLGQYLTPSY
jgi:hypothetical protein